MIRFYALPYSPWSEKARWALDHHGVPYEEIAHVPLIGEARLRFAAGTAKGRVSVPLLVDGSRVVADSYAIARYADERGGGTPLFPKGAEGDVQAWNELSEQALRAQRVRYVGRITKDADALCEALPPFVPAVMRRALVPTARVAASYILGKYRDLHPEDPEASLRSVLDRLESALGSRRYLLGDFSYADITMAVVLQFVHPVEGFLKIGPETRRIMIDELIAEAYPRLLAWRDGLYKQHRPRNAVAA